MKSTTLIIALLFININTLLSIPPNFSQQVNQFLGAYVTEGYVKYASIKRNENEIENLYKLIAGHRLEGKSEKEKKAFYINAYNVIVIHTVVKHYPLKSPMDVKGFFDEIKHEVAGEKITLNELEKKKLLEPYEDARIHFVLVCAAKGCPPLANFAYSAEKLNEQLNERVTLAVNNPQWLKTYPQKKIVSLSKIFDWYKQDFIKSNKTMLQWINDYRSKKIPEDFRINYYEYDWTLNEVQ